MNAKQVVVTVIVLLGSFSLFASAETPSDSSSGSGIEGVITISPAMPGPTRQGMPDTQPLANAAWVVKNEKGIVTSFTTDGNGRVRASLPPGHYTVGQKDRARGIGRLG